MKAPRSLRVVQLTSMHAPLDVRIFYKHARTLAAAGHQVTVLAPQIYAPLSRISREFVAKPGSGFST